MRTFEEDIQAAAEYHGHVCSGIAMGVRMARFAMDYLGIDEPLAYRDSLVYVEVERCLTDAVQVVTGCTLGRRRLKVVDYGKMAATFVNVATNTAVRLAVKSAGMPPQGEDPVAFWQKFSDAEIFTIEKVRMNIPPADLPGPPISTAVCAKCGEKVNDCREVSVDNSILCKACAGKPYYEKVS
jgi:formylmethanofuran dehydrogenase subunit E